MSKFIAIELMNTGQLHINLDHILYATKWGPNGVQFKFFNGETIIAVFQDPDAFLMALQLGNLP